MEKSKFEVELEEKLEKIPENLEKYDAHLKEDKLILQIEKKKSLNELFKVLLENNIKVKNIQNITNELEELFETLTK
jgi:3-methyladenine DNA glycosylase/8-oxoguanine DNA glycosylase